MSEMEKWMLTKLDQSLIEISRNLDISDVVLRLRVSNIFDNEDKELIMNDSICKTSVDKRLKIVEKLKTRGTRAYWKFCHYIKQRCPRIYDELHDNKDSCSVCNGNEDFDFQKCNNCTGLVSVLSDSDSGVFIENVDNVIDVIREKDKLIGTLKSETEAKANENIRLRNENQILSERITVNLNQIAIKEEDLVAKERKCTELSLSRDDLLILNEGLEINAKELENSNKELEEKVKDLRHKYEEAVKFGEENSSEGEKDPGSHYINRETYWKNKSDQSQFHIDQAEKQISSIKRDLLRERTESSQLRIQKDSVFELYERVKLENKRIFEDFEEQLDCAQKESVTAHTNAAELQEAVQNLDKILEEIMLEKTHLVDKLYEKDRKWKETKEKLEAKENEVTSIKNLYSIKCGSVNDLTGSKNDITVQYKQALEERNHEKERNEKLIASKDELVLRVIALQELLESHNKSRESKEIYLASLEEQSSRLQRKINCLSELQETDFEVELRKTSPNSRFGVRFCAIKGPVLIHQSNIKVEKIDYNSGAAPLGQISVDDYVIKINDVNVQDGNVDIVTRIVNQSNQSMKLVLRKPTKMQSKLMTVKLEPDRLSLQDFGVKLSLTVSNSSNLISPGFHLNDEIVQVGGAKADTLSIVDVYSKIAHKLRKRNPIDITIKREVAEETSRRYRVPVPRPPSTETMGLDRMSLSGKGSSLHSRSSSNSSDSSNIRQPPPYHQSSPGYTTKHMGPLENSETDSLSSSYPSPNRVRPRHDIPIRPSRQVSFDEPMRRPEVRSNRSISDLEPYRHLNSINGEIHGIHGQLPPRRSSSPFTNESPRLQERSEGSKMYELAFSQQRDNGYHYIVSQQFDQSGRPIPEPEDEPTHDYENETKTISVQKNSYESFGFEMVGGNKIGIFIRSIEQWKAAHKAEFQVGWRILKINNLSLDKVAFCYAIEYLNSLLAETRIEFIFEIVPGVQYEEKLKTKPYDFFHVEALVDYKPQRAQEMSFNKGDILNITNTHVVTDPGLPYFWEATKEDSMSSSVRGFIPRQISAGSPSRIAEHQYTSIESESEKMGTPSRPPAPLRSGFFYKILDSIGEVLV